MSAFMCDNKTISRIIYALDTWYPDTAHKVLEELGMLSTDYQGKYAWEKKLGAMMFDLNIESLKQRYADGFKSAWEGKAFAYAEGNCSKIQALKSLRCWLYQCMEGNIPETNKLYQLFDGMVTTVMAMNIVNDLDEYDEAEWG